MKKVLTRTLVMLLVFVLTFTAQGMSAIADNVIEAQGETPIVIQEDPQPSESQPQEEPSSDPSVSPSAEVSSEPSTDPSADPSASQSAEVSSEPSTDPSADPSTEPSADPSASTTPASFTVTFVDGTGTVIESQTVAEGSAATAPEAPALEGSTFSGWDTDFSAVTCDLTVMALYTENMPQVMSAMSMEPMAAKTITFYPQNGQPSWKANVRSSGNYVFPWLVDRPSPDPTWANHRFVGWYWDSLGIDSVDFSEPFGFLGASNRNMYAIWEQTYTVTYNGNGNTSGTAPVDAGNYTEDQTVTVASQGDIARTGYRFVGWNTRANGTGTTYASGATFDMDDSNVTLFAQWKQLRTVTYDGNTSTSGAVPVDALFYIDGEYATVLGAGALSKTACTFNGWKINNSGTTYNAGDSFKINGNAVLYAQWKPWVLTYDGNGNDMGPDTKTDSVDASGNITIKPNGWYGDAIKRHGYNFNGWNTAPDGSGTHYAAGATLTLTGPTTLYAEWQGVDVRVSFDAEGGSVSPSSQVKEYHSTYGVNTSGQADRLPIPTRTHYKFLGWVDFFGNSVTDSSTVDTVWDHTLYAEWAYNAFTISPISLGGPTGQVQVSYAGTSVVLNMNESHTFDYVEGGGNVTITAISPLGTKFVHWEKLFGHDDASVSRTIDINLIGLTLNWFIVNPEWTTCNVYTIDTSVTNGTITPDTQLNSGSSQTITYSPDAGYILKSVKVDGSDVDIVANSSSYTFDNVTTNHTIAVEYVQPDITGVTVSGFSGPYDGTKHVVNVQGALSGDTITYSLDGSTYGSAADIGIKDVTPAAGTTMYVKVERAGYQPFVATSTVTITQKALSITAEGKVAAYGTAAPAFTVIYNGFVLGEGAANLGGTLAFDCSYSAGDPTGAYDIMPKGLTSGNYLITFNKGTLQVTNSTVLRVTAKPANISYGDAKPAFDVEYSGFVGGDNAGSLGGALDFDCTYTPGSGTGDYTITPKGLTSSNYTIQYVSSNLHVGKKLLTVTADDKNATYGDAAPAYTVSYSGFYNTDNAASLTSQPTATSAYTQGSNAGNYAITASGGVDDNYSFGYTDGTLTVGTKTLTVTADDKNVTYGDAAPAYTVSYSGFYNMDNAASLTTQPTATSTYTQGSNAGNYAITANGGVDENYSFGYTDGTLTVGTKTLTVTADDKNVTYGDLAPAYTVSYSGFYNMDNAASLTTQPTAASTYAQGSNAGNYAITAGGGVDENYSFGYTDGTLTVGTKTLTVTADDKNVTYGDAAPAYTVSYSGFYGQDTAASLTTQPTATSTYAQGDDAGNYAITADGGVDDNYNFSYTDGTLTVGTKTLMVTAVGQNITYGDAAPAYTVSYNGFYGQDTAASLTTQPTATSTYTQGSGAGSYAITAGGGMDDNYSFSYTNGTLTAAPAPLTVTAADQTVIYLDAPAAYTASITGFVAGDDAADLGGTLALSCGYAAGNAAGTYAIVPSGLTSSNYTITNVNGTLTVVLGTYQVQFLDINGKILSTQTVTYGSAAQAPDAPAIEGFRFVQWDKSFSNITGNLTVSPVYVDITNNAVVAALAAPAAAAPAAPAAPATIPAETVPQAAPSASASTAPSTAPSAETSEQPTETIQDDNLPQAGAAGDDAAESGHGMPMWAWLMIIAGAALFFILFAVWKKKKKKENEA